MRRCMMHRRLCLVVMMLVMHSGHLVQSLVVMAVMVATGIVVLKMAFIKTGVVNFFNDLNWLLVMIGDVLNDSVMVDVVVLVELVMLLGYFGGNMHDRLDNLMGVSALLIMAVIMTVFTVD